VSSVRAAPERFPRRSVRSPGESRLQVGVEDTGLEESAMNGIIYLVGLIVVIMAILSFLGLR